MNPRRSVRKPAAHVARRKAPPPAAPAESSVQPSPLLPLYRFAAVVLAEANHILDFGCGDGSGAELLVSADRRLTCIDCRPAALGSTQRRVPAATAIQGDRVPSHLHDTFDGAVLIDVLGEARYPELVLATVRNGLKAGGRLVVAELLAHTAQALVPPVRRRFTPSQLERLLDEAGLKPVYCVDRPEGIVCLVAEKCETAGAVALDRARHALVQGQLGKAEEAVLEAIADAPGPVREAALRLLGEIRLAQRDGDGAVESLLRAGASGRDARPLAALARLLAEVGDLEEARRCAVRAFEMDRLEPSVITTMAVVADVIGDAGAQGFWQAAARLAPSDPSAVAGYASRCSERGLADDAVRALEQLGAYEDGLGAELHVMLALVLERAGRPEDALVEARFAKKLEPGHAGADEIVQRLAV